MMRAGLLLASSLSVLFPSIVQATAIFPQYAQGAGYRTTIQITNLSTSSTTATVSLHSQSGQVIDTQNLLLAPQTSVPYTLQNLELKAGWASVETNPAADIFATETIQRLKADGTLLGEVSLSPSESDVDWHLISAGSTDMEEGLAVLNIGRLATTVTVTSDTVTSILTIDHDQQNTLLLPSGNVEVRSSTSPISVVAFRMNSTTGWFGSLPLYTSLPQAYFSPNAGISARIVQEIQRAQESIDVAIYEFTRKEIADALIAANKRGVGIRVVADSDEAESAFSQIGRLEAAGIAVRRKDGSGGGIMHNKYAVFDGRLLLTGSYNWSTAAETDNDENALFSSAPSLVSAYARAFAHLWN